MNILTGDDFEGRILKDAGLIAVLFEAEWCPFCREFKLIFELLRKSRVQSAVVNLSDIDSPLWETFCIDIVPTVLIFNSGNVIQRYDGVAGQGLNAAVVKEIVSQLESLQES